MQCKSEGNMEDVGTEKACTTPFVALESEENPDVKTTESSENFQKFMYELFEKNGVMNDLRAYLRGHIIGILRSVRTGDPPPCQKHFTQRLELPYQALNMLLAEYMLRLELSYTLSVFISEIPLGNMVLDFAKCLMQGAPADQSLRFKEEDVWSILNYLGIKCDSEHAANIVEMYRKEPQSPLLLCMLKSVPMYTPIGLDKVSSQESISTVKSSDTVEGSPPPARCPHLAFCRTCCGNILRVKHKYANRKNSFTKNVKESEVTQKSSVSPQDVESVVKNIGVIEGKLIDEMFAQLKAVYEAELRMVKVEEEQRVKNSLAAHATHLKQKRIEMEEKLKAREVELSRKEQQKKRFLWGLAQMLRDQHQQMARAMIDVTAETARLSAKEESLKSQLAEAEAILRSRGEDMRQQISNELLTLEKHLDSMKRERDTLDKERSELQHLKLLCDSNLKITNTDTAKDLHSHYELLKNEFDILKKYLETAKIEPKSVIERGTTTEDGWTRNDGVLNNGQGLDRKREDRVKSGQVVNDLKKMKNVNFMQSNSGQMYRERSRSSPSHSAASSDGGRATHITRCDSCDVVRRDSCDVVRRDSCDVARRDSCDVVRRDSCDVVRRDSCDVVRRDSCDVVRRDSCDVVRRDSCDVVRRDSCDVVRRDSCDVARRDSCDVARLVEENERLRTFAAQQREHIEELSSQQARVRAELAAARLAPARPRTAPANMPVSLPHRMSSVSASPARGARRGAGEEALAAGAPPRALLPGDTLPFIGVLRDRHNDNRRYLINQWRSLRRRISPARDGAGAGGRAPRDGARDRASSAGPSVRLPSEEDLNNDDKLQVPTDHPPAASYFTRGEYEHRPATPDREMPHPATCSKSRGRDAKDKLKQEVRSPSPNSVIRDAKLRLRRLQLEADAVERSYRDFRRRRDAASPHMDPNQSRLSAKENASQLESTSRLASQELATKQDNYTKCDISATYFKNKNATPMKVRPIPVASTFETTTNYLDTSMTEFRQYYRSERRYESDRPRTPMPKYQHLENLRPTSPGLQVNFENPRTSAGLRLEAEDRALTPNTKNNGSLENGELNKTFLSHSESIKSNKNERNPLDNDENAPSQGILDINRIRSPTNKGGIRMEPRKQAKNDKSKELEILKHNIGKIYNLPEKTIAESNNYKKALQNAEREMENEDKVVFVETIAETSRDGSDSKSKDRVDDQNLLRIEVQSITRVDDVQITKSQTKDLLLVVESSSVEHSVADFQQDNLAPQMTILISPKKNSPRECQVDLKLPTNNAGEKLNGTEINYIHRTDANDNVPSAQMPLGSSKDALVPFLSDLETNDEEENVNSQKYDTDQEHSPISMARTSEEENFWDS